MVTDKNENQNKVRTDDSRLFRESIGRVIPVEHDKVPPGQPRARPEPRSSLAEDAAVVKQLQEDPFAVAVVETGDELSYLRPGVQKQVLRKLKRGQIAIQAELDLHGLVVEQAKAAVTEFIPDCISRHKYAVRIIHGKGHGSRDRYPVLKNKLNRWLRLNRFVLGFCSARPVDGGTGAVYVLLKQQT